MQRLVTKLTSKGQATVPVEVRRLLGVRPGDPIAFVIEDGHVWIQPAGSVAQFTSGIFKSDRPPLSPREEKEMAEQFIAEEAMRRGGLEPPDSTNDGDVHVEPVTGPAALAAGIFRRYATGLSISEERRAAEEAIAEEAIRRGGLDRPVPGES